MKLEEAGGNILHKASSSRESGVCVSVLVPVSQVSQLTTINRMMLEKRAPMTFEMPLTAISLRIIPAGFDTPEFGTVSSSRHLNDVMRADAFSSRLPLSLAAMSRPVVAVRYTSLRSQRAHATSSERVRLSSYRVSLPCSRLSQVASPIRLICLLDPTRSQSKHVMMFEVVVYMYIKPGVKCFALR
jgi:hypothetical protein